MSKYENKDAYLSAIKGAQREIVGIFTLSQTGFEWPAEKFPNSRRRDTYVEKFKEFKESLKCISPDRTDHSILEDLSIELCANAKKSSSIQQFFNTQAKTNFANCTTQAIFLCTKLNDLSIESRVLSIGTKHDLVIVKGWGNHGVVFVDPWADLQFTALSNRKILSLDGMRKDEQMMVEVFKALQPKYPNYQQSHDKPENERKEYILTYAGALEINEPEALLPSDLLFPGHITNYGSITKKGDDGCCFTF